MLAHATILPATANATVHELLLERWVWWLLELPDDIMERRCPKLGRFNHGDPAHVRVTSRKRAKPYALKVCLPMLFAHVCLVCMQLAAQAQCLS